MLFAGGVNLKGGYINDKFSKSIYEKYQVTIYRDTWGVPHIFGEKDEDTAYGLGYAHAEDDFETIQNILIAARGSLAQYHGRSAAANDYMVKMLKIWNIILVLVTFILCIFGTFLTRSGIMSSVHSFAVSDLGPAFLGFIVFCQLFCVLSVFVFCFLNLHICLC